jgi:hypothetical protein
MEWTLIIVRNFLEPFSYFIYAAIFFLKLKDEKNIEANVLFWYYLVAAILLTYANFLIVTDRADIDNNWMYNLVYFMTISTLSWYFYRLLPARQKKSFVIGAFILNALIFVVYDLILGHLIRSYNNYVYAICFICIVVYSFMYFNHLLNHVTGSSILNNFNFWLVSGYLLYFLGAFIVVLLYRTVNYNDLNTVWTFQSIILFLSALITLIGYLRTTPKKQYL